MRGYLKIYAKWIVVLPLIGLCGCTSAVLQHDYADYSAVYADSSNKQLLLNLARLSQDDPVYFIQLGSISSQYQISSGVGFTPSSTRTDPASIGSVGMVQHALTFGGNLTAGFTETPQFQFLPLTGSNFVGAILAPITDKVYLTFYDQGYPADLIIRTMVSSIQYEKDIPIGTNLTTVLATNQLTIISTNQVAVIKYQTNYEYWVNDPHDPTYPRFLEFCADLRNAQLCHALTIDPSSSDPVPVYTSTNARLNDVIGAIQAGLTVKCTDTNSGRIVVTHAQSNLQLAADNFSDPANFFIYTNLLTFESETNLMFDNETARAKITHALTVVNDILGKKIKLKVRTFEAAMYCVAKQEAYFEELRESQTNQPPFPPTNDIVYGTDAYGPYAVVTRTNDDSMFKVRPTMTLTYKYSDVGTNHFSRSPATWQRGNATSGDMAFGCEPPDFSEQVHVEYNDVPYVVGDAKGTGQNRTVFTMLCYLFAQTAISTQNLPVQQLIQVQ
ncbi:MAG TPA: hypothetical protein VKU37_03510 [Verrucomicrobiae bacterium]|nr:hypothetical protein [Verrucomicrobiae bacterium]